MILSIEESTKLISKCENLYQLGKPKFIKRNGVYDIFWMPMHGYVQILIDLEDGSMQSASL